MPKARKRPFKLYEGRYADDSHVRITEDMLTHSAFLKLSSGAKVLYIYMKSWACGRDAVTYTASMAQVIMTKPTYLKARDELCKAGFIVCMNKPTSSYEKHEASVFEFSNTWHTGKPHRSEPP